MLKRVFLPFPVLTTERLTLRQLGTNDDSEIFALRSDSEVNQYLGRQQSRSIDEAREFISKISESIAKNESVYWAITMGDNNVLVGTICLFNFSDGDDKCEIGYELLPEFQRQGIMREAAEKVIDYAFNIVDVKIIEASFHIDNLQSVSLLRKLLFKDSAEFDKSDTELTCYHLRNPSDNLR